MRDGGVGFGHCVLWLRRGWYVRMISEEEMLGVEDTGEN